MAANLNPPSHFKGIISDESGRPELIPPASFESSAVAADPWKALAKVTGEILTLKQENDKLRSDKHITLPINEEIKARVDIHHSNPLPGPHLATLELTHYHQIISHQAAEISDLRKQLQTSSSRYERTVAQTSSQLLLKESENAHKVAALDSQLQTLKEQRDQERVQHDELLAKWESGQRDTVCHWREQLETAQRAAQVEKETLESQLSTEQSHSQKLIAELKDQTQEQALTLEEQRQTISQLKTYLSETEHTSRSSSIWKKETDNLKSKLQDAEESKARLEAEMELLKVRLQSHSDLMALQELQLSKIPEASTDKKRNCLLTRWREKVYVLLVQLKSSELVQKDLERQGNNRMQQVQDELANCRSNCQVLGCSLTDHQAQLRLAHNQTQALRQELTKVQQVAITLDDQAKDDSDAAQLLAAFTEKVQGCCGETEKKIDAAAVSLKSFCQRLAFASGRVEMLQSQFTRKEALLRLAIEEEHAQRPTKDTDTQEQLDSEQSGQLRSELERVTLERDHLAQQVRADAELLEGKVTVAKQKVADEVLQLKQRLEELHQELEEQTQRCASVSERLDEAEGEATASREAAESLTAELGQLQLQAEHDVEAVKQEQQSQAIKQLAEMEQQLNEARREQMKAVVSFRQLERQMSRDRDRAAEHAQTLEQYHKGETSKLEHQLRAVDKDRNLLMATLRQEGLVGKYKAQRGAPVGLNVDAEEKQSVTRAGHVDRTREESERAAGDAAASGLVGEGVPNPGARAAAEEGTTRPGGPHPAPHPALAPDGQEPLHMVIDDLKHLTAAILEDDSAEQEH